MKQEATKKRLLALLVATMAMVFALGLTACGGGGSSSSSASGGGDAPSGDVITLISSDSTSPGSAGNKWQLAFKDKLEAVSGGSWSCSSFGERSDCHLNQWYE